MTKKLTVIGAALLLTVSHSIGQTIEIGMDAKDIKQLVQWSTEQRTGYDSYGNSKGNNVSWDAKYYNGQITDVIQCYSNQYLLDFRIAATFCKHYVMEYGKLAYVATQYEDVSVEKLKAKYENSKGANKSDDLYFDDDYKHYSKIYLADNGMATVEWRKTKPSEMPANIKASIDKKLKDQQEAELKRKQEEEDRKKKEKEIISKIYDLEQYDKSSYNSIVDKQKQSIISGLQSLSKDAGSYYSLSSNFIPSFSEIEKNGQKYFTFKNTYTAYYYLEDNSRESQDYGYVIVAGSRDIKQYKKITLVSGDDSNCKLFNTCNTSIPTIQYQGYEVMTKATIKNIDVNFIKGITTVKIKNGAVTYKKNPPPDEFQQIISDKLKSENNGLYQVKYDVGKVMDSSFANTETKKQKSVAVKILKMTGWILLIGAALVIGA